MSQSKPPIPIDDSEFIKITQRLKHDHPMDASAKSGVDINTAGILMNRLVLIQEVEEQLNNPLSQGWLRFQHVATKPAAGDVLIFEFKMRGITGVVANEPVYGESFLFAAILDDSPNASSARLQQLSNLTHLWHPQISKEGSVRLPEKPRNWLELVESIRRIISYETYETDNNILNTDAAEWANANQNLFPLKSVQNSISSS
jgi:hypothetical protein